MNLEELKAYVADNYWDIFKEACKYLCKEDGVWACWGDISFCIYYDEWEEGKPPYYYVTAYPLRWNERSGYYEEVLSVFVRVAEIKTIESIEGGTSDEAF
jgi:hypothetical protein